MQIRLTEPIRYCSDELPAGAWLDLPEGEAQRLIDAGHAQALGAAQKPHATKERSK